MQMRPGGLPPPGPPRPCVPGPGELWTELRDARLRLERQEAAMAGERAETDAVIEDLREQLNLRMLELQDLSALKAQGWNDSLELREAVSDLSLQLAEKTQEVHELASVCSDYATRQKNSNSQVESTAYEPVRSSVVLQCI